MLDLVNDAVGNFFQHVVRDARPIRRHGIHGRDGADGDDVFICTVIPHDPDRRGIGDDREVLPNALVQPRLGDLVAQDVVGVAERFEFFARHLAHDANGKPRTGEGLTHDHFAGQTEFETDLAHFVLEEVAERLDDFVEIDDGRKPADVVMALDDVRRALAALDDVGIDGALYQKVHFTDLFRNTFERADEFFADDLAFLLGIGYPFQLRKEVFAFIRLDEIHAEFALEYGHDLLGLVLAQQAVVDEYADELIADGFM